MPPDGKKLRSPLARRAKKISVCKSQIYEQDTVW